MYIDKSLKEWFSMPYWDKVAIDKAEQNLKSEAYDILMNEENWHIERRRFVLNNNIGAVYSLAQELSQLGIEYWEQFYYIKQLEKENYSKDFIKDNKEELERIRNNIQKELKYAIYQLFANEVEYLKEQEEQFSFNMKNYTYYDKLVLYYWSAEELD